LDSRSDPGTARYNGKPRPLWEGRHVATWGSCQCDAKGRRPMYRSAAGDLPSQAAAAGRNRTLPITDYYEHSTYNRLRWGRKKRRKNRSFSYCSGYCTEMIALRCVGLGRFILTEAGCHTCMVEAVRKSGELGDGFSHWTCVIRSNAACNGYRRQGGRGKGVRVIWRRKGKLPSLPSGARTSAVSWGRRKAQRAGCQSRSGRRQAPTPRYSIVMR
jgi:hypothetical protein